MRRANLVPFRLDGVNTTTTIYPTDQGFRLVHDSTIWGDVTGIIATARYGTPAALGLNADADLNAPWNDFASTGEALARFILEEVEREVKEPGPASRPTGLRIQSSGRYVD